MAGIWKQMWCSYIVIAQLEMKPPAYKVAVFLHCIGVDALKIFNGFQFDGPGDENDLANIIQEFDEFAMENWTKPLKGTLSTPELNRKTKALMLMLPPFAHSRKHVIFVTACLIRSFVTGSSWALKITALANGFYKNGVSLCQRISIFAMVLKHQIWKRSLAPRTMSMPWKITHYAAMMTSPRKAAWRNRERDIQSTSFRKRPAWDPKCTRCGSRHYFETTCTTQTRKLYSLRDESSADGDVEYITSIFAQPETIQAVTQEYNYPKVIYTEKFVDKKEVKLPVDSGASVNVISVKFVADKKLEPTTKTLQMGNDTTL